MINIRTKRILVKPLKWWVALLIALLVVLRLIGVGPRLSTVVVLIGYALCLVYYVSTKPRIDSLSISFLGLLLLALILSSPDEVFRSELRFALFCAVFLISSSLFQSEEIRYVHRKALVFICRISIVLSVISFFGFFLGINLMTSQYTDSGFVEDYENVLGGFSGIFIHSMILGPMASIAAIYAFDKALRKGKIVYWLLWVLCVGSVFMAASRAALLALVIATVVVLFSLRKRERIGSAVIIIAILFAILLPSASLITNRVVEKQRQREEMGIGVLDTRSDKYYYRLKEFWNHPLQGVGFAAIDPDLGDEFNPVTGVIEPGSSWLAVLSMSGLIGFIPFLLIVLRAWLNLKNTKQKNGRYYLFKGLLVFFFFHLLFEGYIFSAGNPMCLLVWLVIYSASDWGATEETKRKRLKLSQMDQKKKVLSR